MKKEELLEEFASTYRSWVEAREEEKSPLFRRLKELYLLLMQVGVKVA